MKLPVFEVTQRRFLVTRESAHEVWAALQLSVEPNGEVVLDLSGVRGASPSFADEFLALAAEGFQREILGRPLRLTNVTPELAARLVHHASYHRVGLAAQDDGGGAGTFLLEPVERGDEGSPASGLGRR